ncbi:MAG TPA: 2-C-methyl-D-erythritol 4-phosphate cytidylyltransferase [Steroidobacteraceae bacterium]|jgi:2-C-methyl-D-erythritol 4-phosphate cytidylyltransferase|nr:2-C-methyl-D-erythritol 4-phosphate cytidylyltransferase [Steroidobacteraceae bacterium]
MRYWLVMPAAGAGQRFGAALPKQYAVLEGRTVIEWALAPFLADGRCQGVVVALAAGDAHFPRSALPERVRTTSGGAARSTSVRAALELLAARAAGEDWVLVHDAARPCLQALDLGRLLDALADDPVGGLLAARVHETLKRETGDGRGLAVAARTEERAGLWRALTPQMFRFAALCAALDEAHAAGRFPSDEAQALEWRGAQPRLIEGSAANLKITTAQDLELAAALLRTRRAPAPGETR